MTPVETGILAEHAAQSALLVYMLKILVETVTKGDQQDELLRRLEEAACTAVQIMPVVGVVKADMPAIREHAMIRVTDIISATSQLLGRGGEPSTSV